MGTSFAQALKKAKTDLQNQTKTTNCFFDEWEMHIENGAETRQPSIFDGSLSYYVIECEGVDYRHNNLDSLLRHWADSGARKVFNIRKVSS